jgi:hypothetical protein
MPLTRRHLAAMAIVLAASLPYLRTIPDYFVQDDFGGMQLLAAKPWHTFPQWFTMPWMEFIWGYTPDEIRPFTALSYQITVLGDASAPEGHHVLNIALHAANGLIVLGIARTAGGLTLAGGTVAALVFVLLPLGAESVAWITGRVDSLPAFFYLLTFHSYARWRRSEPAHHRLYVWSVIWFFAALFSKQNTITMIVAIAAFDWIVLRRSIRPAWAWLWPYLPFALMTAGFLALRYAILGEVLRERQLTSQRFAEFGGLVSRHLQRMVWGDLAGASSRVTSFAAIYATGAAAAVALAEPQARGRALRSAFFFGIVWVALGLAPTVAAGYESPRHAYLAAVGWAILIGLAFDLLRQMPVRVSKVIPRRPWHGAVAAATLAILVLYGVRLHREVSDWRLRSAVAHTATIELERQVLSSPEGSLFIVGVPVSSWEWAAPFVARPPYTSTDLTTRAEIVMPLRLHCCRGAYWDAETRAALEKASRTGAPIVALYASPNGEIRRLTDTEDPDLRTLVESLSGIRSTDSLDGAIQDILRKLVAGRGRVVRAGAWG